MYIPEWSGFHQTDNAKINLIVFCDDCTSAYGVTYLQQRKTTAKKLNINWFFKKQMHHNKKIRAYDCRIGHSDERKNFKSIRYCC